jgi:hypothetical protein
VLAQQLLKFCLERIELDEQQMKLCPLRIKPYPSQIEFCLR